MGIRGLSKFLKNNIINGYKINQPLSKYEGKIIAVDFNIYLYKFLYIASKYETNIYEFIKEKFLKMTYQFNIHGIKVIYVMDGKPSLNKNDTIQKRKNNIEKNRDKISKINNVFSKNICDETTIDTDNILLKDKIKFVQDKIKLVQNKVKLEQKSVKIDIEHCKFMKEVFDDHYISYIHIPNEEADFICKYLVEYNIADYCLSNDLDMLAYGCKHILCNYNYNENLIDEYNYLEILEELKLNDSQFLDICISCGTDYNSRLTETNFVYYLIVNNLYKDIPDIIQNLEKINISIRNKILPFHLLKNSTFIQNLSIDNFTNISQDVIIQDDFKIIPPSKLDYFEVINIFTKQISYDKLSKFIIN